MLLLLVVAAAAAGAWVAMAVEWWSVGVSRHAA